MCIRDSLKAAELLQNGKGGELDADEAYRLLRRAADATGDPLSLIHISMCIRDSQNAARALMAEVNPLKHRMEAFSALKSRLEDIDATIELASLPKR